ncbi:MAG TPA: Stf0 family sulfotransferase [Solirubrobacterales bacterium]|nr:Stf0 family sulfotransferase [Solirubrobacterales bacterium]
MNERQPDRSYLVCATPRSGSTLVCHALEETGVAGRPEEYFEALRHSGRPRRPEEYFLGVEDQSIRDHLGERSVGSDPQPRSPLWSRAAYDRYLEWAFETGTTDNGVFGAKLMWGYFGEFVSLLRNIPACRDVPLGELLPSVFPDLTFVRVVRANKVRQAVSLWKAVQTATWREDQASAKAASVEDDGSPPYRSFVEAHRPQLRFHYRAIDHLLEQLLIEEASWDAFFEHAGIKPILILYENFAAAYETSTLNLLERLDLTCADDFEFEPRMKRQSDRINDDWTKRYSELRLGRDFDLVPAAVEESARQSGS